jgi:adenosylcobinamide-GDP ribazoletransferase
LNSLVAALAFYTCLPVPASGALNFQRVACLAPIVGVLIGALLVALDQGLIGLDAPSLSRSATEVGIWLLLTGGLHLDGAIDAADGLAVPDPQRRLAVMTESTTGAFGVMAAVMVVLLKLLP